MKAGSFCISCSESDMLLSSVESDLRRKCARQSQLVRRRDWQFFKCLSTGHLSNIELSAATRASHTAIANDLENAIASDQMSIPSRHCTELSSLKQ